MIEQLFGSRTRTKLLNLFTKNEDGAFFVREITRKIGEQINSVRRELANLKELGLLNSKSKNGKLYYSVNVNSEIFNDLKNIMIKTANENEADQRYLKEIRKIGHINYAALMGVFVGDQGNRIDLFLVGEIDKKKLNDLLKKMEEEVKQEINYTILTFDEFRDRQILFDRFVSEILERPKEVLIDNM